MIDVRHVFERLNYGSTRVGAVQEIRRRIDDSGDDAIAMAGTIINSILGIDREYTDPIKARLVAMAVAEESFRADMKIDNIEDFLTMCEKRIDVFMANPKYAFCFAKLDVTRGSPTTVEQVVDGLDCSVAVRADGKIKKGGREVLAAELYKKHVLTAPTPLTNQEFIAVLVKELGMSKPGATTYAYNMKKKLGEPAGGIVKAKRGRKAAV